MWIRAHRKSFFYTLLFILILLFLSHTAYNQTVNPKNKVELRSGISFQESFSSAKSFHIAGRLSLSYRLTDYLEPGINTGYAHYKIIPAGSSNNPSVIFYGIHMIFHISPLCKRNPDPKLNLYIIGSFGGFYMFLSDELPLPKENRLDYGMYAGMDMPVMQRFGVYLELGYGNTNLIKVGFRVGLTKNNK